VIARKSILFGAAIAMLSAAGAGAADFGATPVASPIYLSASPFTWAGPYLGVTAGYANAFHSSDDLGGAFLGYPGLSNDQSQGFAGGGTLGINWQTGGLVYGLETDIDWLSNKSTYVDPNGAINNFYPSETNRLNYLGTVRGRLGLAVDRTLLYVTAGLAYGGVTNTVQYNSLQLPTFNTPHFNVDSTRVGWVVGTGLEHAFAPNWTIKGEALYAQLDSPTASWVSPPPGSQNFPANAVLNERFNTSVAIIRAGVNYKFDWFGM
jgi:outer membrane immunogenic protein